MKTFKLNSNINLKWVRGERGVVLPRRTWFRTLFKDALFTNQGMTSSDLDRQIEQLMRCEYLKESDVKNLCARAREILMCVSPWCA